MIFGRGLRCWNGWTAPFGRFEFSVGDNDDTILRASDGGSYRGLCGSDDTTIMSLLYSCVYLRDSEALDAMAAAWSAGICVGLTAKTAKIPKSMAKRAINQHEDDCGGLTATHGSSVGM